jgi:hypothetical protein
LGASDASERAGLKVPGRKTRFLPNKIYYTHWNGTIFKEFISIPQLPILVPSPTLNQSPFKQGTGLRAIHVTSCRNCERPAEQPRFVSRINHIHRGFTVDGSSITQLSRAIAPEALDTSFFGQDAGVLITSGNSRYRCEGLLSDAQTKQGDNTQNQSIIHDVPPFLSGLRNRVVIFPKYPINEKPPEGYTNPWRLSFTYLLAMLTHSFHQQNVMVFKL